MNSPRFVLLLNDCDHAKKNLITNSILFNINNRYANSAHTTAALLAGPPRRRRQQQYERQHPHGRGSSPAGA